MALLRTFLTSLTLSSTAIADLIGIPTVPFNASKGTYNLNGVRSILVDSKHANATDQHGQTLIPPTLLEFANTFASDWKDTLHCEKPAVESCDEAATHSIFITISNSSEFRDVAGRWTSEAYTIDVRDDGVTINGASPLGAWWGTRTLLQQAALNNGSISIGHGVDTPGWGTRGIFLDAGRHYYPPDFLVEMCNWISYWKQNVFHLHLSDNLYNNVDIYSHERTETLYAAFRLWSNDSAVAGLNKRQNESYTREDFDHIQSSCASRGVTVIPEIEAPGHALVITQWKPELGISDDASLLNISYPDTLPTMKTIWKTFLPWFHSKVVHIGADEYVDASLSKTALVEEYNHLVIELNSYIRNESDKDVRIWGTFPPMDNYTSTIPRDVSIQHWEFFEDNPYFDYIKKNYSVVNSDDSFYIVQKYSTSYPAQLNKTRIFHGNPDGSAFSPNIFDQTNATNNPPKDSPYVIGHIAAQWNDYGPNTSTYLEGYYPWRYYLPALADKQWGGSLLESDYDRIYPTLQSTAPVQNLDRNVKSKTSTILEYNFASQPATYSDSSKSNVKDLSGNNYHATTNCNTQDSTLHLSKDCSLLTPLTSKGNDYTLSFSLKQASKNPGPLFSGPDSSLHSGNGTSSQVMLIAAGNAFALNYSLPVGQWTDASLIARGNKTFLAVDGGKEMEFLTKVGVNGERFAWARMAVVAPLSMIGGGGWEGEMKSVKVVDHA
ncbi:Beta-hexosaminidase [Fulvia fulva]|uniref:beta-N-acetylhexosaminidase n=1 Tax=Passalora fulva TaxID=5499 RepID=A0A9Q8PIR8_PASFU|nr:Beta-hexosaminidase [Fulvia fulva]KAK4626150.1 Beta-hexosaminidase [Fulvia fulva]KAK4628169.1 Beta-hexosaminidase [Fulvia fulva]UJO23164.1 Beta-hexosaminidase [Fulvia fulva]WPV14187.1 Beta-hexosaminidase [Fulvia fulva]WPV29012.1 Beta-hexosaminidase [Fulvia fulva]